MDHKHCSPQSKNSISKPGRSYFHPWPHTGPPMLCQGWGAELAQVATSTDRDQSNINLIYIGDLCKLKVKYLFCSSLHTTIKIVFLITLPYTTYYPSSLYEEFKTQAKSHLQVRELLRRASILSFSRVLPRIRTL